MRRRKVSTTCGSGWVENAFQRWTQDPPATAGGTDCCPLWYLYLAATEAVATPPRLLRTVMFCGFVETLSSARYWPPPLLESVPRS
jgi:hypothetical protein